MTTPPDDWVDFEDRWLAPYAMRTTASRGRRHAEPAHPFRTAYQRDRERIVHSSAFRRMTGKTQVLVASVNDHHRTRLTHTLEVTQVARTVARRLRLNEDLTEAIALAHDIGHPPFGHAGEEALNECLKDCGGFNHNLYGLRRIDELEERYPEFPGLNLTYELREAFVQHGQKRDGPESAEFHDAGAPLLEAQVVDLVDSIAYDTHDVDDALEIGFVTEADLHDVDFWQRAVRAVRARHPDLSGKPLRTAVVRELLAAQVNDLLEESANRLNREGIRCVQDVRRATTPLVGLSFEMELLKRGLERFLRDRVYRHHRVLRMTANGKRILRLLYEELVRSPELLPERQFRRWKGTDGRCGPAPIERVVADYLAGMTDRYAQREYGRLFQPSIDL
jgi:dGTPase